MNTKKIIILLNILLCFIFGSTNSDNTLKEMKFEEYYTKKYSNLIETIVPIDQYKININLNLNTIEKKSNLSNLDKNSSNLSDIYMSKSKNQLFEKNDSEISIFELLSGKEELPNNESNNIKDEKIAISSIEKNETNKGKNLTILANFEATIFLDESLPIARTQTEIKSLLCPELPETDICNDCDCITFNNIELSNNNVDNSIVGLHDQLDIYQKSIDDILKAKTDILNQQKSDLDSILNTKEIMLADLDKEYRKFKDASYQNKIDDLNRYKEENDLQKHIQNEELKAQTKKIEAFYKDQIDAIKDENSAWFAIIMDKFINNTPTTSAATIPQYPIINHSQSNSNIIFGLIIFILISGFVSTLFILKQKPQPIYLKPKNNSESIQSNQIKKNNMNKKVNSDIKSLRQSAVTMSVGNKNTATKVVREWLDDKNNNPKTV